MRVATAWLTYLAASLLLGHWQVDDAGITFAYARNLAEGFGLVSQPGFEPVEGYSNPAWMLLCAALVKSGLFQPDYSAKALAGACVLATLVLVDRLLSRTFRLGNAATLAGLVMLGLNASFVIWCNSGLENSLYALLSAAALLALCRIVEPTGGGYRVAIVFGIVSAGLALTRPDGLIYFGALPVALALTRGLRAAARLSCAAVCPYVLLVGGHLAARWMVFHAWLPNTALMKGSGSLAALADALLLRKAGLAKLVDAFGSLCPLESGWLLVGLAALVYFGRGLFRRSQAAVAVGVFAAIALAAFLLLPLDWMPYQRFATPLVVAMCVLLPALWREAAVKHTAGPVSVHPDPRSDQDPYPDPLPTGEGEKPAGQRSSAWGACAVALLGLVNVLHVWDFSRGHIVSFDEIRRQSRELNSIAATLDLADGSVLAADVGGLLWNSRLQVYDLLGLTDRTVAATFARDKPALYDYIFAQVRPTFIKAHRTIFDLARLDQDPRLAGDYVLLRGDRTAGATSEAAHLLYVRRSAVRGKERVVAQIRGGNEAPEHFPGPGVYSGESHSPGPR